MLGMEKSLSARLSNNGARLSRRTAAGSIDVVLDPAYHGKKRISPVKPAMRPGVKRRLKKTVQDEEVIAPFASWPGKSERGLRSVQLIPKKQKHVKNHCL
jgi:hypothetical protein